MSTGRSEERERRSNRKGIKIEKGIKVGKRRQKMTLITRKCMWLTKTVIRCAETGKQHSLIW